MAAREIDADFLIVGAGAMGMAFADVLLTENSSARIAIVDRHARPGGHWNDAYPFVALHQPAAFYGVCSEPLGRGGSELASGVEVLAYYHRVLQKFLATGRVHYFPMCEHRGEGRVVSIVDPDREVQITVRDREVDATYMNVQVPSVCGPQYEFADDVPLVPLNDLAKIREPYDGYVVIGAGKTGMDAALFLLEQGVDPELIRWVMPHDAWLLDRAHIQPGQTLDKGLVWQLENIAESSSLDEVFRSLERDHKLLRLDPEVWPERYRCATVSREELTALRGIQNVVRRGRVLAIEPDRIVLEDGSITTDEKTLHVDCSADGLARRPIAPVFQDDRITLQSLSMCQQVFSAAVIAHIEGLNLSRDEKNALCGVVPHPHLPIDFLSCLLVSFRNLLAWTPQMGRWLRGCRLNFAHHESFFTVFRSGWRLRKVVPRALERMEQILAAERRPSPR